MSSRPPKTKVISRAELKLRNAFDRLKAGKPDILPKGSKASQNNVAKEAGVVPSALRRSRYPELADDIERWNKSQPDEVKPNNPRAMLLAQRSRSRELREQLIALKAQRDIALSKLLDVESRMSDLVLENARLKSQLPQRNVVSIHAQKNGKVPENGTS